MDEKSTLGKLEAGQKIVKHSSAAFYNGAMAVNNLDDAN
jgi:hypothetical protein